jgi:N,N'-diacetyllegionaminate synthase
MFEKIFIIAEAGSNHNGDLKTAIEMVHQVASCGADAIKFQDFSLNSLFAIEYYAKTLGLTNNSWQRQIKSYSIKPEWHRIIYEEAKSAGITYFTTPFSIEIVDEIDEYVPFFKIASCDITFFPLLKKVASKGKGIFLSTGASTIGEMDMAVDLLRKYNPPFLCIMHCIMLYPPPIDALHLNFIQTLSDRFNLPVGFSDHSRGTDAALLAIGKGAKAIEKHFTLNKNLEGSDHKNSLNPTELRRLVKKVRLYEQMLGSSQKIITEMERKERIYARRGIYAARNLKKGEELKASAITFLRPNISIGVEKVSDVLGRKLTQDVSKGEPIDYSMFE